MSTTFSFDSDLRTGNTFSNQRAASECPAEAARWRGVQPQASQEDGSAPLECSNSRHSTCPPAAASWMGWPPPLSTRDELPPASSSILNTSKWPCNAAVCILPSHCASNKQTSKVFITQIHSSTSTAAIMCVSGGLSASIIITTDLVSRLSCEIYIPAAPIVCLDVGISLILKKNFHHFDESSSGSHIDSTLSFMISPINSCTSVIYTMPTNPLQWFLSCQILHSASNFSYCTRILHIIPPLFKSCQIWVDNFQTSHFWGLPIRSGRMLWHRMYLVSHSQDGEMHWQSSISFT